MAIRHMVETIRRFSVGVLVCLLVAWPAAAQKGGHSHSSSGSHSHSSSGASTKTSHPKSSSTGTKTSHSKSTSANGDKTVHVKAYTKKDGTHVEAHERRAPGTVSHTTTTHATSTNPTVKKASGTTTAHATHNGTRCVNCDRDAHGRILRSSESREAFMKATGFPKGRSGYVIDHIVPLACGGADLPSNMQWQTAADAKAKDKTERKGCGK